MVAVTVMGTVAVGVAITIVGAVTVGVAVAVSVAITLGIVVMVAMAVMVMVMVGVAVTVASAIAIADMGRVVVAVKVAIASEVAIVASAGATGPEMLEVRPMYLPFEPETLDSLRKRYPRALEVIHDAESVRLGTAITPGSQRMHVFDSNDGLRLIISRETLIHGGRVLHVSASVHEGTTVFEELKRSGSMPRVMKRVKKMGLRRFLEISGEKRQPVFLFWTDQLIPHWALEDKDDGDSQSSAAGRPGVGARR